MGWQSVPILGVGQVVTWAEAWDPVAENMADSGWLNFPNGSMVNGWENGSPAFYFRLIGNRIVCRGVIQNGSNNTSVLTLPSPYQPTTDQQFICFGASFNPAYVTVSSGGLFTINISGGAAAVDLSNVSYYND